MKDKLFWIALGIAGLILFNKFSGQSELGSQVDEQQERQAQYPDRGGQSTPTTTEEKRINTGKYGDLKLPKKQGESSTSSSEQQRQLEADLSRNRRNTKKQIDAGEYGTLTLPSKNQISTSSTGGSSGGSSSSYGNSSSSSNYSSSNGSSSSSSSASGGSHSTSSTSTSSPNLVILHPETKAGSAIIKNETKLNRLVLEDEILQLADCHQFNIYIDTKGYCNANQISGCSIYVKQGGELILPSSCLNNVIYYEIGATIRTTSESIKTNDFHEFNKVEFQ